MVSIVLHSDGRMGGGGWPRVSVMGWALELDVRPCVWALLRLHSLLPILNITMSYFPLSLRFVFLVVALSYFISMAFQFAFIALNLYISFRCCFSPIRRNFSCKWYRIRVRACVLIFCGYDTYSFRMFIAIINVLTSPTSSRLLVVVVVVVVAATAVTHHTNVTRRVAGIVYRIQTHYIRCQHHNESFRRTPYYTLKMLMNVAPANGYERLLPVMFCLFTKLMICSCILMTIWIDENKTRLSAMTKMRW